jgi:hypothetical protein
LSFRFQRKATIAKFLHYQAHTLTNSVFCVGVLSDIQLEVPPLQELVHPFSVYFLVPGDYSLQSSSVIIDATDVLRARAKAESPDEPILCRGSPFQIHVVGTE